MSAVKSTNNRAVVLLSGGLDSATVLAMAAARGLECHALSIDYGQRHSSELNAAKWVATSLAAVSHRVIRVDLGALGGSALTDSRIAVPTTVARDAPVVDGIPVTYVPARNTILLAIALAQAEVLAAGWIYVGVNAVDYSGYPDCRPEFIAAFRALAALATKQGVDGTAVAVEAPLIQMSKADIVRAGTALGVDYSLTVSCYQASESGEACGHCDSCRLRAAGFAAAGISDPTRYQKAFR